MQKLYIDNIDIVCRWSLWCPCNVAFLRPSPLACKSTQRVRAMALRHDECCNKYAWWTLCVSLCSCRKRDHKWSCMYVHEFSFLANAKVCESLMTIVPWPWLPFRFWESKAGRQHRQASKYKDTWDHREATKWQASNTVRPTRWMYRVTSATGSCIHCTIQPNNDIEIQPFKSATHHSFRCFLKRLLSWFQYLLMLSPLTSTGSWKLITVLMFGLERERPTKHEKHWKEQKHDKQTKNNTPWQQVR